MALAVKKNFIKQGASLGGHSVSLPGKAGRGKGGNTGWGPSAYGGGGLLQNVVSLLLSGKGGGLLGGKGGGLLGGKGKGGKSQQSKTFTIDNSGGELGEFTGTIKSFVYIKHYGFITCDDLAEYGDVFLHGDILQSFKVGDTVKFDAVVNKEGKVVASELRHPRARGNSMVVSMGGGKKGGKGGGFTLDMSGGELGEFSGTIKSFVYVKNYGFITCDDLAEYGDVFLHGDILQGFQVGDGVKFDAVVNKDGKVVASELRQLGARGNSKGGGKKGGKGGGFTLDKSGGELGEFSGTVKSFVFVKNYGFITCDALAEVYGGDVFLHGDMLNGVPVQVGQAMTFKAVLNKDGKPVATDVRPQ